MFADSYPMREVEDGFFFEVDGSVRRERVFSNSNDERGQIDLGAASGFLFPLFSSTSTLLFRNHENKNKKQWQEVGNVDVDIGANPSAEGADGDEAGGGDEGARKIVDIIESFRLVEQPSYDKKALMGYVKPWLARVVEKLPEDKAAEFKAKAQDAIKFLLSKVKELQFFTGESMDPESTLCYAYYKDGNANPTFLFCRYAMDEVKC